MIEIRAPFKNDDIEKLVCGDIIKLSGVIYTARDAAHKRMIDAINNGSTNLDFTGILIRQHFTYNGALSGELTLLNAALLEV